MEEGIPRKPFKVSGKSYESIDQIYDFSYETFGYLQAERYDSKLINAIETLTDRYLSYP